MSLLTKAIYEKLKENGSPENRGKDHHPVVKFFLPGTGCTWLITEVDNEEPYRMFGLCDLGLGYPELGYVDLREISAVKSPIGLTLERDLHFEAKYPISVYADAARITRCITEDGSDLLRAVSAIEKRKPQ